ncbi:type II toxin-antitoxin system VapC family toxin [Flexivirga caeni]|uniref:Ribonuclease VapC n=1 Tax=Flexivirga caeni TaxID=2294115 RepID=A0A3M9M1W3_9MICO|nr:type II toxin-antitoxin system VapC family toxin [Flexivirga caeni]RNI19536.1 PIN domain-containing protein [Flexivirga caeni]
MSDVPVVYVDTSALGALLVAQAETDALLDWLGRAPARLVSSDLLETELRRLAVREERDQAKVSALLDGVSLAALDRAAYRSAGLLPLPHLRTLDALHLEAALRLDVDAVLTYDNRLGEAARAVGLEVIAPGAVSASHPDSGGREIGGET